MGSDDFSETTPSALEFGSDLDLYYTANMQVELSRDTLELFITDSHFPLEDPAVFSLQLQVARALKPRILWLNGDMLDFKSVSRFRCDPNERLAIDAEIKHARNQLRRLREACPTAAMYFKAGNHDQRLQKYLWDRAPELANLEELELPKLLRLRDLDCAWVPNEEKARIGRLWHLHGNEIATGFSYPAQGMLRRANDNVVFGHVHRFSVMYQNALDGSTHVAWSIGCGQSLVVDFDQHPQWQQGFAVVEYTKSGIFHVNPVEVFEVDGKKCCMVMGRLYRA